MSLLKRAFVHHAMPPAKDSEQAGHTLCSETNPVPPETDAKGVKTCTDPMHPNRDDDVKR